MPTDVITTEQANKETVRALLAAFTACDVRAMDGLLAPDFVAHGMPPELSNDAAGMKQSAVVMHAGLQDCRFELGDLVAEGDRVAIRYTARARHTGELFGVPPSGRTVTITGMELYRVSDGRVAEYWGESDMSDLFEAAGPTGSP